MNPSQLAFAIKDLVESYPPFTIVWHRASGQRGVVSEYNVDCVGCAMLFVAFGPDGCSKVQPGEVSLKPVPKEDGDEWMEEKE